MPYLLSNFLEDEIRKRQMSAREFAHFIGVSHQTIGKFLDYGKRDVGYPSADFILKLAKATNTNPAVIMAMIDPDVPTSESGQYGPDTRLIADQVQQLSDLERRMVQIFIRTLIEARRENDSE